MEVFPGVSMGPDVRFGKPCLAGTRIDVATIVASLASGRTVEQTGVDYALSIEQCKRRFVTRRTSLPTFHPPFAGHREGSP